MTILEYIAGFTSGRAPFGVPWASGEPEKRGALAVPWVGDECVGALSRIAERVLR